MSKRNSKNILPLILATVFALALNGPGLAKERPIKESFSAMDVFKIAYAANPVMSPNGQLVAFDRFYMDVMTDTRRNHLWLISSDGSNLRQVSKNFDSVASAAFTPSGDALAFVAVKGEESYIYMHKLDTGERVELGEGLAGPANLSFSPDGQWLAFTMPVDYEPDTMGELPPAPDGAEWAAPLIIETRHMVTFDGAGYLPFSSNQIFIIPTSGGAAQQLTEGRQDYTSPLIWLPDSSALLLSSNVKNDVNKPLDTDIIQLDIKTRQLTALTTQLGPDSAPQISPDGKRMSWIGNEYRRVEVQRQRLYTAGLDGSDLREWTSGSNFSVSDFAWHPDGHQIYVQYEERGNLVLALLSEDGSVTRLSDELSGWELDQPYVAGKFSANRGLAAFTKGNDTTTTELAVVDDLGSVKTLTDLNHALHKSVRFATAEEHTVKSSFDKREIQYWIMVPPDFDRSKSYPLLLQIHGGPQAAYGPHFAANNQLYAAAGYVVVYSNPRGSTGYGEGFVQAISHNYPSRDYDDLMDVVDATIDMGFIDEEQLFVTGGSGGGTLTAWIVGKTDRFRAAVAVNPVINWISSALTIDLNKYLANHFLADLPWNDPMGSWSHSPLSLVGNVSTPTMLMTGEQDMRTPIAEAEQYFNALQIEGVDTALVRVPGASHWIENRPSQLIAKVNAILAWFDKYSKPTDTAEDE